MYTVKNNVEDIIIGQFLTDAEFTHFMRNIAVENDDEELSITCIGEAMDYLNNYCSNLELVDVKEFDVISPDGFSIHPVDTYPTYKEAIDAFNQWKKRYEIQGYYSSMNYGRISLDNLFNYCKIISHE